MAQTISDAPHAELRRIQTKLSSILQSVATFGSNVTKPPIIDASVENTGDQSDQPTSNSQDTITGLRTFRDAVRRDLDVLEKFLSDSECASLPTLSTNAPYLISVWDQVLIAPLPVTAVWATFSETGQSVKPRRRGHSKENNVKVDVVADGGRRWARVNTIKNSKILAEFRVMDSYLTDSEDDEDHGDTTGQAEFDNSVLQMGRSLVNAAKQNPLLDGTFPSVTLHLTRLDPSPENPKEFDQRIPQTILELKEMGIEVRLGEIDEVVLDNSTTASQSAPTRPLEPTIRLNLDLSILIAFCSDLTHAPLPPSAADADARFMPSDTYVEWKKSRVGDSMDIESIARPCKALSNQALQEMIKGLFQDIHDRLSALNTGPSLLHDSSHSNPTPSSYQSSSQLPSNLEFWTTPDAKERCLRIIAKIGGMSEKRRSQALFPPSQWSLSEAEEQFWKGSRYPLKFIPLLPVRLLSSSEPDKEVIAVTSDDHGRKLSPFFHALEKTCCGILAQEVIPDPRTLRNLTPPVPPADHANSVANGRAIRNEDDDDGEIQRATVTKANPRLTAHTVQTMLWGSVKGWTTLTANKMSVKAILREVKSGKYCARWDQPGVAGLGDGVGSDEGEIAALWVVDPRSLAEGMRSDYSESSSS